MPARPTSVDLNPAARRKLAGQLFNYVWTLLEKGNRTPGETEQMVHAAHASRFFWDEVGEAIHQARGEWQISRVYATVERAEPALHHARSCLAICQENGLGGFDLGYAHEALARAQALAGEHDGAAEQVRMAQRVAAGVEDPEDRQLLLSDLATLPD